MAIKILTAHIIASVALFGFFVCLFVLLWFLFLVGFVVIVVFVCCCCCFFFVVVVVVLGGEEGQTHACLCVQ